MMEKRITKKIKERAEFPLLGPVSLLDFSDRTSSCLGVPKFLSGIHCFFSETPSIWEFQHLKISYTLPFRNRTLYRAFQKNQKTRDSERRPGITLALKWSSQIFIFRQRQGEEGGFILLHFKIIIVIFPYIVLLFWSFYFKRLWRWRWRTMMIEKMLSIFFLSFSLYFLHVEGLDLG